MKLAFVLAISILAITAMTASAHGPQKPKGPPVTPTSRHFVDVCPRNGFCDICKLPKALHKRDGSCLL